MKTDTFEQLLAEMRDAAEWRWEGYEDHPGFGYHDEDLKAFAERLGALLREREAR